VEPHRRAPVGRLDADAATERRDQLTDNGKPDARASQGGVARLLDAVDATREFLRDALGFSSVDAGGGWLIFALPPADVAVHPAEVASHELYLMCDNLPATIAKLTESGAVFGPIQDQRWGRVSLMTIPGGAQIAIYQPSHPRP
jgi:hypothetical protein